jgi:hypothetical protein
MGVDVYLKLKPFPDYDDQVKVLCEKEALVRDAAYLKAAEKYSNGDVPALIKQLDEWQLAGFNDDAEADRKWDEVMDRVCGDPEYVEIQQALKALSAQTNPHVPFCDDLRDLTGSCWRWNAPLKDLTGVEFLTYLDEHCGYGEHPVDWTEMQLQCDLWIEAVEKHTGEWRWSLDPQSLLKGLKMLRRWSQYALDHPQKVLRIDIG